VNFICLGVTISSNSSLGLDFLAFSSAGSILLHLLGILGVKLNPSEVINIQVSNG